MPNSLPDLDAHLSDGVVCPTEFPDSCEKCDLWQAVTFGAAPECLYYDTYRDCLRDKIADEAPEEWDV
jgi:hypothetical protein